MKKALLQSVVVALAVFMGGCNVINPAETVPTYVAIDSFAFQGNPGISGSNSHRINSVFVFLNNQSVGVYDLPAVFPVIMDKPGKLMMTAGINYNGMHSYQVQYPFYLSDTVTLQPDKTAGSTRHIIPTARYHPNTVFAYMQDFENYLSAPFINYGGDTTIGVESGGDALEGKYGVMQLTSVQDSSVNIMRDGVTLPVNKDLYLEMDYKSTLPITVGMQTTVGGEIRRAYILGLNPRETWGKIYIDLRTFVSTYQGGTYKLILRAEKSNGAREGRAMVDNLKIVHL